MVSHLSGQKVGFWDAWFLAALGGTGEFEGLSRTKRVVSLKKATMGLMTYYASHELDLAISRASVPATRSDSNSGHVWDEGWAFYRGHDETGKNTAWEVAVKR